MADIDIQWAEEMLNAKRYLALRAMASRVHWQSAGATGNMLTFPTTSWFPVDRPVLFTEEDCGRQLDEIVDTVLAAQCKTGATNG